MLRVKCLVLHPLSGTEASLYDILFGSSGLQESQYSSSFSRLWGFWKKNFEKNFGKIWRICLRVLTFAPAFENEASVFEVLVPVGFLSGVLPFRKRALKSCWKKE